MGGVGKREELEERRQLVSEAAWRILVRDGLGELSVRNVAAEAGLAPSSLRYVFPTQASVREQAVSLVRDRLTERLRAVPTEPDGRARARAMLLELMPLDADRRMEMEVYLALGTAASKLVGFVVRRLQL
jgi:AcrR family transcriptional regulator